MGGGPVGGRLSNTNPIRTGTCGSDEDSLQTVLVTLFERGSVHVSEIINWEKL